MSVGTAHLLCLLLVVVDFVARTWRTQLYLRALGYPLSFREVLVQSAIGETASSLTPLRAGGEPARLWAMRLQGVPGRVGVVAIGVEFLAVSVVIVAVALALGFTIGGDWWAATGPRLIRSAMRGGNWLAAIGVLMVVAWLALRRLRPDLLDAIREELGATRGHLRDLPLWVYVATVPVSLLNIGARVAILPVLATTLDQPPPIAATIVGSFALLYAQAIIPTPAGAGAVELGFLGGAVGNLGADEAQLLLHWRIYTTVIGTVLGVLLALWRFHANILPFILRRQPSGATAPAAEVRDREPPDPPAAR